MSYSGPAGVCLVNEMEMLNLSCGVHEANSLNPRQIKVKDMCGF